MGLVSKSLFLRHVAPLCGDIAAMSASSHFQLTQFRMQSGHSIRACESSLVSITQLSPLISSMSYIVVCLTPRIVLAAETEASFLQTQVLPKWQPPGPCWSSSMGNSTSLTAEDIDDLKRSTPFTEEEINRLEQ